MPFQQGVQKMVLAALMGAGQGSANRVWPEGLGFWVFEGLG